MAKQKAYKLKQEDMTKDNLEYANDCLKLEKRKIEGWQRLFKDKFGHDNPILTAWLDWMRRYAEGLTKALSVLDGGTDG